MFDHESRLSGENSSERDLRSEPVLRFPLGTRDEILYLPAKGIFRVVKREDASLLGLCARPDSMEVHAARLVNAGSAKTQNALDILSSMRTSGLLVSNSELLDRLLQAKPTIRNTPALRYLAIPTANRPKEVSAALASFRANVIRYGHTVECVVSDDTDDGIQMPEPPRGCSYLGRRERTKFVNFLAKTTSVDRALVEFALLGPDGHHPTMGANRNSILLHTAGNLLFTADDDTLCEAYRAHDDVSAELVTLGAEGDPTCLWFFPDRATAFGNAQRIECDVVAEHSRILGKSLNEILSSIRPEQTPDTSPACGHIFANLAAGTGRIRLTLNGSIGDSGMYSGRNILLTSDPTTRSRLLQSPDSYHSALQSRELLRQSRSTTICHSSPFIGMFVGMDNRSVMPPFFPSYRNEDGVFGCLLGQLYDDVFFGYLPWALVHDARKDRVYAKNAARTIRMSDVAILCASTWKTPSYKIPVETRLHSMGRHLVDLASMRLADFEDFLRVQMCIQVHLRMRELEKILAKFNGEPRFWALEIMREIEAIRKAVTDPSWVVPVDIQANGPAKAFACAQHLVTQFGRLLCVWPSLFEAAKNANQAGLSFGTDIPSVSK